MSQSLFGGSASTVADVGKKLEDLAKQIGQLTEKVQATRNPNMTADAVIMDGNCPAPLVGCNAAELYKATGGLLTCPPVEQAPDPIIADYKGRICYAPKSLREAWKGKKINIRTLTEEYALKLAKMLQDSNNLAVAVKAAQEGPKGSPIVMNYYANNPFVKAYVERATMYGGTQGPPPTGARPAVQQTARDLVFDPPAGLNKDQLAAMLTKFSNQLDVSSGAVLVSELLNSVDGVSTQGVFDADDFRQTPGDDQDGGGPEMGLSNAANAPSSLLSPPSAVAALGAPSSSSAPMVSVVADRTRSKGAAQFPEGLPSNTRLGGGANGVGQISSDPISWPTHSFILQDFFTLVVATHRDSIRRAKLCEAINGLAVALDFGELAQNFDTTRNRRNQAITASNAAISFLPKLFRDWISAGKIDGQPDADSRFTFAMFVVVSLALICVELYETTSSGKKYVNSIKALRVAYTNMRKAEDDVKKLLEHKANGANVFQEEIDRAMTKKRGASQSYVIQTVKLGKVLADLLSVDIKGSSPVLETNPKHLTSAIQALDNLSNASDATDKTLASAYDNLSSSVLEFLVNDFRGVPQSAFVKELDAQGRATGRMVKPSPTLFSGKFAARFYQKIIDLSKLNAFQIGPEEAVFADESFFSNQQNAQQFATGMRIQDRAKFESSLPAEGKNFCKLRTNQGFVYLHVRTAVSDAQAVPLFELRQNASRALEMGDKNGYLAAIDAFVGTRFTSEHVGYIAKESCQPLESGEDAIARKVHYLGSTPIDQLIRQAYTAADLAAELPRMQTQGLSAKERDMYTTLQLILHWASGDLKSMNLAAANLVGTVEGTALVLRVKGLSNTFASHGKLQGGNDVALDGGEDVDIEGGDDWELFADKLLNGGNNLSGGATRGPVHQSPDSIHDAVNGSVPHKYGKNKQEIQKMLDYLAAQGYKITYFYDDKCPSYLHNYNNTFGTPGEKKWVETKNPWAECQRQMGFQFVSKNGYCYPHGMTCFPQDDLRTTTHKTAEVMDNFIQLSRIYNSVQQKKYQDFLDGEVARIRAEPQNANLTDAEVMAIAKRHVPAEFEGIPEYGAVQTLVTLATQIEDAAMEITSTSDSAVIEEIKRILRSTGSMRDDWADDDAQIEAYNLQRKADEITQDAKLCTDASIAANTTLTDGALVQATGMVASGQGDLNTIMMDDDTKQKLQQAQDSGKCDVIKTNDGPVLIPRVVSQTIDLDKLAKGGHVDHIAQWWRDYYGAKAKEEARKLAKISAQISPTGGNVPRATAPTHKTPQEVLEDSLKLAIEKKARGMLPVHHH